MATAASANPFEDLLGLNQETSVPKAPESSKEDHKHDDSLKTITYYKKFDSFLDVPDNFFVPSIQRTVIKEHLNHMRKYIQECVKNNEEPVFGTIDLVLYKDNYYLVDGQHRFVAIQKEFFENKSIIPVHTLVYEIKTSDEVLAKTKIEDIFKLRNRGIPVPNFILSTKEEKKDLLKDIVLFLDQICPSIFKQVGGHTRPKININAFIENFRKTELFRNIKNLEDFRKVFNELNLQCYHKIAKMTEKQMRKYGITENMISVWSQHKIYVGYSKDFDYLIKEE